MIKCLQAAGRCVRSESDRGVAIFIDERFLWSNYRKAFPSDMELHVTSDPENLIREFWGGKCDANS
jgi:DNA excision repair protein ERCC-2